MNDQKFDALCEAVAFLLDQKIQDFKGSIWVEEMGMTQGQKHAIKHLEQIRNILYSKTE